MQSSRRKALFLLAASAPIAAHAQVDPNSPIPPIHRGDEEQDAIPPALRHPDAMIKQQYKDSLKDAEEMVDLASDIRSQLEKSGTFVVSVETIKKTEQIEKLARRIRSRLKS